MYSLFAYSEYAFADAPSVDFVPPALQRLAEARTSNPILFLEISARENTVTTLEDALPSAPGLTTGAYSGAGYSMLGYSSESIPRTQRDTVSFLFSTRPWTGSPSDTLRANQRAIPRLISPGRITRTAPIDSTVTKRGQRTIGDASIANPDGALDYILTGYTLTGGFIKCWLAEPQDTSDEWALLYEATIDDVEANQKDIRISITTIADQLKRSLQTRRYAGSGGYAGDATVAGRLRPTCWGECGVVDPVLMNTADRVYQVHDGQIQAVDYVSEGGLNYDFTADYPDYSSLALATLDTGEYATSLAYGLIRIGTTLEGLVYPIRAGVKGDARGNGYVSATGDILYRLARDRAFLAAEQVNVASFNGLPRARVGYYTNGSQDVSVEDVYDDLLGGIVATYGVGRDAELSVSRMLPADFALDDLRVSGDQIFDSRIEVRPYTPRVKQPYTYSPNFAPLAADEISPEADGSTAARLQAAYYEGEVFEQSSAAIPPIAQPPLVTYFVQETAAQDLAEDALLFSSRNLVPVRAELGQRGLLADIGKVIAIDSSRFATDFRGVIYEQEDILGASVRSRVTALG